MDSYQIARQAAQLAWEKKGNNIVMLDVRKLTDITDFFIIISGDSDLHVKAICDYLEDKLSTNGLKVWHREGYQNLKWVLLDFIDIVVHIFREQSREFYSIEKLWGDARIIRVEEDAKDKIIFAEEN